VSAGAGGNSPGGMVGSHWKMALLNPCQFCSPAGAGPETRRWRQFASETLGRFSLTASGPAPERPAGDGRPPPTWTPGGFLLSPFGPARRSLGATTAPTAPSATGALNSRRSPAHKALPTSSGRRFRAVPAIGTGRQQRPERPQKTEQAQPGKNRDPRESWEQRFRARALPVFAATSDGREPAFRGFRPGTNLQAFWQTAAVDGQKRPPTSAANLGMFRRRPSTVGPQPGVGRWGYGAI